jgi:hypothetical protein
MIDSQSFLRIAASWLLVGTLSGLVPAKAAEQPGTLAESPALPAPRQLLGLSHDLSQIAALPRTAQQSEAPVSTGASTSTHHVSRWVWVAIVAAAGVGIGVGVVAGNKQTGKTAATTPTATIGAGSGGVTAGAP